MHTIGQHKRLSLAREKVSHYIFFIMTNMFFMLLVDTVCIWFYSDVHITFFAGAVSLVICVQWRTWAQFVFVSRLMTLKEVKTLVLGLCNFTLQSLWPLSAVTLWHCLNRAFLRSRLIWHRSLPTDPVITVFLLVMPVNATLYLSPKSSQMGSYELVEQLQSR